MKNNQSIRFTLFLAMLLMQPALAAEPQTTPIAITPAQQQTLGIKVAELGKDGNLASQRLAGEVVIPVAQERVVTAPQAGLVTELYVSAGQSVKKGQ